jgi:hypothetical protein
VAARTGPDGRCGVGRDRGGLGRRRIKQATIAERRPGDSFDAVTYVFKNARLSKFEQGGRQEPALFEQGELVFTSVEAT